MTYHILTRHAETRMRQRGLRDADIAFLVENATQVAPDAYLFSRADADRQIAKRKREIQQLERLKDCKVVVEGGTILTCYHATPKDQKRTFRKGRTYQ